MAQPTDNSRSSTAVAVWIGASLVVSIAVWIAVQAMMTTPGTDTQPPSSDGYYIGAVAGSATFIGLTLLGVVLTFKRVPDGGWRPPLDTTDDAGSSSPPSGG
ncbi:MAG: hypothetical protein AB7K09_11660 [Planctomycetota bacterium]